MNNTTGQTPGITATTPTSGAADLPEALRRSAAADGKTELFNLPGYPLMVRAVDFNRIHTESEMRRTALLDEMQNAALAAGQATAAPAQPAPENIRGILARCRDFIDTTKAPAYPAGADLADEIDVLLAAQPAPQPSHVAQAAVPADLITIRKPTTSAETLWLLKLARLVISDVDKTLETATERSAERVERGLSINLNHSDYYTMIEPPKDTK